MSVGARSEKEMERCWGKHDGTGRQGEVSLPSVDDMGVERDGRYTVMKLVPVQN